MRLIFVRHGEPDYQNDCLTENGREQAKKTADRLAKENIQKIYSSPMGRAVETASYTADACGLAVQVLDFMHEIEWGDIDPEISGLPGSLESSGHPWTLGYRLLVEEPSFIGSSTWSRHHFFKDNLCLDCYKKVSECFDQFLAGHGLIRKNGIYEYREPQDKTIALFAHGGSGAIMFSHVLNLPFPFVLTSMPYGVCSVSIIDFTPQEDTMVIPRLELFNDMGHIDSYRKERLVFEK